MIEHLSFTDFELGLRVWHKKLKNDGRLVTTCPDLISVFVSRFFFKKLFFKKDKMKHEYCYKMIYGSQEHEGMFHKSGYTAKSLKEILSRNNFKLEFSYTPYPQRLTPSLLCIARKK